MFNNSLAINSMNSTCCRISYLINEDTQVGFFISHNNIPYMVFSWHQDDCDYCECLLINNGFPYSTAIALDIGRYSFSIVNMLTEKVNTDSPAKLIFAASQYNNFNSESCNILYYDEHADKVKIAPYRIQEKIDIDYIKNIVKTGDYGVPITRAEIERFYRRRGDKTNSIV